MLPCVCSVIDHRWRQNVVRTKSGTRGDSRVCHWCSYHILSSSVIYYWTDARQHGIYLFYTIKNIQLQLFISKSFSVTRKPAFAHFGKHEKKPFDVICCLYKMKLSYWLLCITKNCDWFLPSEHPCGPKNLNVSLTLLELKEYARKTSGCGQHWTPFDSNFEWKER